MSAIRADLQIAPPDPAPAEPGGPLSHLRRPHIRGVAVFGAFMAIFAMALRPVVDPDVFWHLATGRYIWSTGHVPYADPFSWTAQGRAWIAHEWLTETLLYPLYLHGGYAALMLVFAAVITAAFAITYATARLLGASRPIGVGVTLLAAVASSHTWGVRPQMLSLLLLASAAWLLTHVVVTGRRCALWLLPPLMALWANLHGGFIFGLALIGIFALGQTVVALFGSARHLHARVGGVSPHSGGKELRPPLPGTPWETFPLPRTGKGYAALGAGGERFFWRVFAACVAACLLNPNGLKGLIYPFTYLGNNASTRYIAEWVSPDFHQFQYQLFEALILALIAGAALSRRRPTLSELLLALAFTHFGLNSVRNINLFSIVVAPLIAVYLSSALLALRRVATTRDGGESVPVIRPAPPVAPAKAALNLLLAAVIAGAVLAVSAPGLGAGHNVAMQARRFPAGAVTYLNTRQPSGPLFNSYDWGGYLIWRLYPRRRVYVDGRPDMYGDRFMDQFIRTWQAQPGWQATLRRQGVRLVLVEPTSGLGHALAGAPGWRLAYHDTVAVLYERTA